jgi:hypothetical protein
MMSRFISCTSTYTNAVKDRKSYRAWKLLIDIDDDGDLEDITSYISNNSISGNGKRDGTSRQFQATLKNGDKTFQEGQFAGALAAVEAKVGDSSEYIRIFSGYVSKAGLSRVKNHQQDDNVTVNLVDDINNSGMRRKADPVAYVGYSVCTPSATTTSIFHLLAYQLGYIDADLDVGTISDIIPVLTIDGSRSVWEELRDLAECWNGQVYITSEGKLAFHSRLESGFSEPSSEWTFDSTNIHKWSAVRNEKTCTRAIMEFDSYESLGRKIVYRNTDNFDEITGLCDIELAAGAYWPGSGSGSVAKLSYKDPETGETVDFAAEISTPTIGTRGSGADIECTGGLVSIISFNGSTSDTMQNGDSSEIILKNETSGTIHIRKIEIRGTAYRIISKNKVYDEDNSLAEYEQVEKKIPGKFVKDADMAHSVCNWHVEYGKVERKYYSFETDWIPQVQEGALVRFTPPGETTDIYGLVESYSHPSVNGPMPRQKTTLEISEYVTITPTGSAKRVETSESTVQHSDSSPNLTTRDLVGKWPHKNVPFIPNGSTPDYLKTSFSDIDNWRGNIDNGIYGYWSFNNSDAADDSGNGHAGTVYGPTSVSGKSGNAFLFDGVNDYIDISSYIPDINADFSLSLWFQIPSSYSWDTGCAQSIVGAVSSFRGIMLCRGSTNNTVYAGIRTSDANRVTGVKAISRDTWYHAVVLYKGASTKTLQLYLNAVAGTETAAFTGTTALTSSMKIGRYVFTGTAITQYFTGIIDEVRVYTRILSEYEIGILYSEIAGPLSVSGGELVVPVFARGAYRTALFSLTNTLIAIEIDSDDDGTLTIEYESSSVWSGSRSINVIKGIASLSIYGSGSATGIRISGTIGFKILSIYAGDGAYLDRSSIDVSGCGSDGRITGAVPDIGKTGSCLFFNGGKSYIEILFGNLPDISGDFSFSVWIEGRTRSGTETLFRHGDVAPNLGVSCDLVDGKPSISISSDGSTVTTLTCANAITVDTQVTFKYLAGVALCIEVNGIVEALSTTSIPTSLNDPAQSAFIGSRSASAGMFYGWLDGLELHNRYISSIESKFLYTNPGGNLANVTALEQLIQLDEIANDAVITPQEKPAVQTYWKTIYDQAATATLPTAIASMYSGILKTLATTANGLSMWTPTTGGSAAKALYDAAEALRLYLYNTTNGLLDSALWDENIPITATTWEGVRLAWETAADGMRSAIASKEADDAQAAAVATIPTTAPKYLGYSATAPASPYEGQWFFYTGTTGALTHNTMYLFQSSAWVIDTNTDHLINALGDLIDPLRANAADHAGVVTFFENLVVVSAFIENLRANILSADEIYSEDGHLKITSDLSGTDDGLVLANYDQRIAPTADLSVHMAMGYDTGSTRFIRYGKKYSSLGGSTNWRDRFYEKMGSYGGRTNYLQVIQDTDDESVYSDAYVSMEVYHSHLADGYANIDIRAKFRRTSGSTYSATLRLLVDETKNEHTPGLDDTTDFGSSSLRWKRGYFSGDIYGSASAHFNVAIDCYKIETDSDGIVQKTTTSSTTFTLKKPIMAFLRVSGAATATLSVYDGSAYRTYKTTTSTYGEPVMLNPGNYKLESSDGGVTAYLTCDGAFGSADGTDIWT